MMFEQLPTADAAATNQTFPSLWLERMKRRRSTESEDALRKIACCRGFHTEDAPTAAHRNLNNEMLRSSSTEEQADLEAVEEGSRQRSGLSVMKRYPLFQGVNHRVLASVASGSERRLIQSGEFIFKAKQEGGTILLLSRGKVACYERKVHNISVTMKDGHGMLGKETLCALALRAASQGASVHADDRHMVCVRASSVVALTPCEVLVIRAEHLAAGMLRSRRLADNIRNAACGHLRELTLAGSSTAKRLHERITLGNPSPTGELLVRQNEAQAQTKQRQLLEALKRKISTIQVANAALELSRCQSSSSPCDSPTARPARTLRSLSPNAPRIALPEHIQAA